MRYSFVSFIIVTIFTWVVDLLIFKHVNKIKILPNYLQKTLFLFSPLFFTITFLLIYIAVNHFPTPKVYLIFQYWLALYFVIYFSKTFYLAYYTTAENALKLKRHIFKTKPKNDNSSAIKYISRRKFITITGMSAASLPFLSISYGILKGRFDFRRTYQELSFPNLPSNFRGIKIVQISDMHLGTFMGFEDKIKLLVDEINNLKADLLIITGDFVNNFSSEIDNFVPILSQLKASIGKIAILGNHDYGDYSQWDSMIQKKTDQQKLQSTIKDLGFRILLNELIAVHINGQEIGICGVENWGHPPFPKYGDLQKASKEMGNFKFNILLTHDPDHWEEEVIGKKDFELTLSGHTHGMQLGIEWKNFKWSPASWRFKRWGGLYKEGNQYLYINRGFGSIGLPARIGMPPEITIITLI